MCLAINSSSEDNNATMILSVDTCKINIKVGPTLTREWADLIACTSDETESAPGTSLRRFFYKRGTIRLTDQLESIHLAP